jgi:hypothetical protein
LSDELAEEVRNRAKSRRMSVSAYLAELVRGQVMDPWPEDFFSKVVGGWVGEPLERPEQSPFSPREDITRF